MHEYENDYTLQQRRSDLQTEAAQIRLARQVMAANRVPKSGRKRKNLLVTALSTMLKLIHGA